MSDTPMTDPTPSAGQSAPAAQPAPRHGTLNVALLVALAALGVSGWQFYQTQTQLAETRLELARQIASSGIGERALKVQADATAKALRDTETRLVQIEARVNESAGQYATLEGMYQSLTNNRSDWLQAEVEHSLTIASQQLLLAGNVGAAVSALEMVEARLARFDNPQLIALKRAVSKDLASLKSLPYVDSVGVTLKLDQLMLAVDALPLAVDHHRLGPAKVAQRAALPQTAPWWERALSDFTHSIGELVNIRRMDKPEALLLSPEQAFFLRENLKMRLLDARIALMARQGSTFATDIAAAESYVARYFDRDAPATRQWLATLATLKDVPLDVELPELTGSLKAVHDLQGQAEVKP
ncbi:uroporphyrinogen-III C-methyltransferase [Crenobacter intestini]|nr:uroporphyrinogen-III C-methyltransferase [Crenobacter intestini]